jgi:rhodanese-related sulfurtransferase
MRMAPAGSWKQVGLGVVALVAAGVVVGAVNNVLAGKSRRLDWVTDYPEQRGRNCEEEAKARAAAATAASAATTDAEAPTAAPSSDPPPAADPAAPPDAAPVTTAEAPSGAPPAVAPPAATAAAPAPGAAAESAALPSKPADVAYVEITSTQAKTAHDAGALFVDARFTSQYEEGHVAGALSIPIWESGVDEAVANLPFDEMVQGDTGKTIVVYCNGGDCEDSHSLSKKLWEAGFMNVYVYKDGYPDWLARGWQVLKGSHR